MTKRVRTAEIADHAAIESLWLELNALHVAIEPELIQPVDVYLEATAFEQILEDSKQEILLVEEAGRICGAVWLVERRHEGGQAVDMPVAFIQEICVAASVRRQGIGRALMDSARAWAEARALARVEFNVWARNRNAIAFYQSLGYGFVRHEMYLPL